MTGLTLWSQGFCLDDLGRVGDDLTISSAFGDTGCGIDKASWSMSLPKGFAHPAIQAGARVQIKRGDLVVGVVILDEPDVEAWTFSGSGLVYRAAELMAVNSEGTPTANLADALTAQATAWGITLPPILPTGSVTLDSPDQVLTMAELLARWNTQNSARWGIVGDGFFQFMSDPTTASYAFTEDTPSLPSATGSGITLLRVRYSVAVDESGTPTALGMVTASAPGPIRRESFEDITNYGALTSAQAQTVADGLIGSQASDAYGAGITAGARQLTTIGDVPVDGSEWMVVADVAKGAMFHHYGWRNPDFGEPGGHDWIAGSASWSKSSGITVTPLGMAVSTFGDMMASLTQGIQGAQDTANTAKTLATPDWLQSLINADSVTTMGGIPTSAVVGDLAVIGSDAYVCTVPYTSGGTLEANWVQATDPTTIALVVQTATAVLAADNANSAAQAAQLSANGKNKVTYAASAPTTSSAGVAGDTWWVFSSGQITAQYKLTSVSGSTYTWSSVQVASQQIANLDVGKLTGAIASFLEANITDLTSVNITSSTITASDIVVNGDRTITFQNSSGTTTGYIESLVEAVGLIGGGAGGSVAAGGGNVILTGTIMGNPDLTIDTGNGASAFTAFNGWHFTGSGGATSGYQVSGFYLQDLNGTGTPVTAQVSASGQLLRAASTRRFKSDIQPILDAYPLATLRQVAGVLWRWIGHPDIEDGLPDVGLIGEWLAELGLDVLVDRAENGDLIGVKYDRAVAFLWAMTNHALDRLDDIEARLTALEAS